jgi:hypothetical protein
MAFLLFFTAVILSGIAAYYSVIGLIAIFSAAVLPVAIMGGSLEAAKLVVASWLYRYWKVIPFLMKAYFTSALVILMLITSMGIFGFLSKAHSDQSLVSGDVLAKISVYDEKIKTAKENIDANRKALKQMDEAVDQVMGRSQDEKGADKAVALRRGQAKERTRLLSEIAAEQKLITKLSEERAPIAAEVRKVEAEVGPLKYIAAMIYGDNPDENMLERSVRWLIILLICVFDPLAVLMLIAANLTQMKQKEWKKEAEGDSPERIQETEQPTVTEHEPVKQEETKGEEINDIKAEIIADKTELQVDTHEQQGTREVDTQPTSPVDNSGTQVEKVGEQLTAQTDSVVEEPVKETKKKVKKTVEEPVNTFTEQKQEAKSIEDQVNTMIQDGDQNGLETVYRQIVKELAKKNRAKSTHWGPIKSK